MYIAFNISASYPETIYSSSSINTFFCKIHAFERNKEEEEEEEEKLMME